MILLPELNHCVSFTRGYSVRIAYRFQSRITKIIVVDLAVFFRSGITVDFNFYPSHWFTNLIIAKHKYRKSAITKDVYFAKYDRQWRYLRIISTGTCLILTFLTHIVLLLGTCTIHQNIFIFSKLKIVQIKVISTRINVLIKFCVVIKF